MGRVIKLIILPLFSLFILSIGNGLLLTLVSCRLSGNPNTAWLVGVVTAAFFSGLLVSAMTSEMIIFHLGHVRAFIFYALIFSIATVFHGFVNNPLAWIMIRFVNGCCFFGILIVIESWILAVTSVKNRGQIFAFYMSSFYAAHALGQFLLHVGDPSEITLFCIAAIFCALSIVPLFMKHLDAPKISAHSHLKFLKACRLSPNGFLGCFCAGMLLGVVYGVMPSSMNQLGYSIKEVALIMGVVMLGGMIIQYPIGNISDHFDRENVLIGITVLSIVACLGLILFVNHFKNIFILMTFIFGGAVFVFYPVSVSNVGDTVESKDVVAVLQKLAITYGAGATLGPLLAPVVIKFVGDSGLFVYFMIVLVMFMSYELWHVFHHVHHKVICLTSRN